MKAQLFTLFCILLLLTQGCATLTTAAHFSKDGPMVYSGTRLDVHAAADHDEQLRLYREKYGVQPPAYPVIDLPFSVVFDTLILFPIVLPIVLYETVFD